MQLVQATVMARFLLASFLLYSFSNAGKSSEDPLPTRVTSLLLLLRVPGGTNDRRRSSGSAYIGRSKCKAKQSSLGAGGYVRVDQED